ncbi:potassium voltage-gated channel subfamily KQT member 1-like isoform X15 [Wyeomyia smithii]|uniref:potassium voltage-gated channel subfamily KQT member 1-like isoform X15 n=1 Tax=Wyeomyia smithii TaxID=174621 RepID=UPI002467FB2C|nr:potassium voltage-gated channel subfamily KQT member 1-like isoform X15 [Wyeomyia smithii]
MMLNEFPPHLAAKGGTESSNNSRKIIALSPVRKDNNKSKYPAEHDRRQVNKQHPPQMNSRTSNCNNKPYQNNNYYCGSVDMNRTISLSKRRMLQHSQAVVAVPQIKIVIDDTEQKRASRCSGCVSNRRQCISRPSTDQRQVEVVSSPSLLTPSSPPASFWGFGFGNGDHNGGTPTSEDDSSYVVDFELDEVIPDEEVDDDNSETGDNPRYRHQLMLRYGSLMDEDEEEEEEEDEAGNDNGHPNRSACKLSDKNRADRLARPRMSLLGKPLNYNRGSRRDARYRRLQSRVYNFLERPRGVKAILYHVLVFFMVFTCLALSVFSTIQEYELQAIAILFVMEIVVVVWFSIEFFLRLWSSGCRSRYQGAVGRLKFLKRPFCIIDVVTIVASIAILVMRSSGQVFAASALRGLRFFQILRMVRMDRRGGTWKLLGSVVYAHRQELITTLYIGFLGLIFASFLVYLMEKDVEGTKFNNFAQALWWGVITLCTVGYGDMVPDTWQGKIIASFCALLGISFFALPAGILGSGFALKVQQQQRQKHMIRRRQPAATLIQSLWRCYAADEHSLSEATWKIHQVPLPSPPPSRASSSFKHNASFVARLPTIRRHKSQSLHSPGNAKPSSGSTGGGGSGRAGRCPRVTDINASSENLEVTNNGRPMNPSLSEDSVAETALSKKNSDDEDEEPRCVQLTNQHKGAIRFIRKMKYFVARRKFKEALKPYDVKDVMEQYAAGHVDLLGRVKNVQTRLDQILGKQGSKSKDVYASKISLASRVVKIERQVDDIETKVDTFIELYMQDRKRLLSLPLHPDTSHSNNPNLPSLPPKGGGAAAVITSVTSSSSGSLKPKPILIDKQFSEPNSPIAKTFEEPIQQKRPPMQRGYSDLGHRIKKRVTLSSIPPQYVGNSPGQVNDRGDVVIVVPNLDPDQMEPVGIEELASVCIDTEIEIEPGSPKTITESSIIMMDEEDDDEDEEEDIEEEELDIGGEIDPDSPPWDMYGDLDVDDQDESTENTALLRTAAKTEIIVTPISPVSSAYELHRLDSSEDYKRSRLGIASTSSCPTTNGGSNTNNNDADGRQLVIPSTAASGTTTGTTMDSLKPEMTPQRLQRLSSEDI